MRMLNSYSSNDQTKLQFEEFLMVNRETRKLHIYLM